VREGDEISMYYDPMIAKLVTHGATRDAALDAHGEALDRFHIEGIQDNIPFIAAVVDEKRFRSGNITTAYIKDEFPQGFQGVPQTAHQEALLIASATYVHAWLARRAGQVAGRIAPPGPPRRDWVVILGDAHHPVTIDMGGPGEAQISVNGGKAHSLVTRWQPGQHLIEGVFDGKPFAVKFADRTEGYIVRHRGVALRALVCTPFVADLHARLPEKPKADTSKLVISPMPGLVVSMDVTLGQEVQEGEAVCIVEAMKMQNIIRAGANGKVKAINVKAGDSVAADEIMVEFA
jgi:propionyl-CoA carboxylase alpha chain